RPGLGVATHLGPLRYRAHLLRDLSDLARALPPARVDVLVPREHAYVAVAHALEPLAGDHAPGHSILRLVESHPLGHASARKPDDDEDQLGEDQHPLRVGGSDPG